MGRFSGAFQTVCVSAIYQLLLKSEIGVIFVYVTKSWAQLQHYNLNHVYGEKPKRPKYPHLFVKYGLSKKKTVGLLAGVFFYPDF